MATIEIESLGLTVNIRWIVLSVLLGFFIATAVFKRDASNIPVVNAYPRDFMRRKAHAEFMTNARGLIIEGFKKFNGPFRILTPLGSRIILPSSYTEWVRKNQDLDHQALVAHEFLAATPGFDGLQVVTDPGRLLIDVTRTKLSQNAESIGIMREHVTEILEETWTENQEWHEIGWSQDATKFIARTSAAVFVGPELARDPEWLELTMTYTMNLFMGVRALRAWPEIFRSIIHWFIRECKVCRTQVKLARGKIQEVIARREKVTREEIAKGRAPTRYEDTITWMAEDPTGRVVDAGGAQLAFAISALHTTSELLKQTVLDLCEQPKLVKSLREEINNAISESGWSISGLFKMQLLDSVVKEAQRLKPGSLVNLERQALRETTMPNGVKLPRGSSIAVDVSEMWNADVYERPDVYDGMRFQRLRQSGNNAAQLASSSAQHMAFGMGKPICPGRFFVTNEIKVVLATMLLNYDMRLQSGAKPRVAHLGFEMLSDPEAQVEIRRRQR